MVSAIDYQLSIAPGVTRIAGGRYIPTPSPVDIGTDWLFLGDSETSGRALETSANSQVDVFETIWNDTFAASVAADSNGVGGRETPSTHSTYLGLSGIDTLTFINFQDSGGQSSAILDPADFVTELESFIDDVIIESPNAVLTIETAYSFEEASDSLRYWPLHNEAMRPSIAAYRAAGMEIYIAEVDRNITELVTQKRAELGDTVGQQVVWGGIPPDTIDNHYTGLGNLMVALSIFEALGYDVSSLDLSTFPTSDISAADKALCVSIIQGFA